MHYVFLPIERGYFRNSQVLPWTVAGASILFLSVCFITRCVGGFSKSNSLYFSTANITVDSCLVHHLSYKESFLQSFIYAILYDFWLVLVFNSFLLVYNVF